MAIQAQLYSENLAFSLGGSQEWVDNGCVGFNGSCFNLQQHQQQYMQQLQSQQEQIQSQRNYQNFFLDNSLMGSTLKNSPNYGSSQSLASQFDNQRQEIDQFITLQSERLRLVLQEQRKQQLAALMRKVESKALALLRQKDEEIAKATNRAMELEDFLRKLEMENQAWQRVAKENEAKVMSLNHTIEQIKEKACGIFSEDAESCCDDNMGNREEGTGENRRGGGGEGEEDEEDSTSNMVCRGCNSRNSCVLLLPCRHFCSCKACEGFFDHCPVCQTEKKGWIEARIF